MINDEQAKRLTRPGMNLFLDEHGHVTKAVPIIASKECYLGYRYS